MRPADLETVPASPSRYSAVVSERKRTGAYATADGQPRTRLSIVAYFDLLGFTQQIRDADEQGRSDELLQRLAAFIKDWYGQDGVLHDKWSRTEDGRPSREVRAFTDDVVMAHPLDYDEEGEAEMAGIQGHLSLLQMAFAFDGFFLRGGLAVGDVYVDSTIVYGKAFLDAVEAEKKANWPRIVFARSAIEYVHKHLGYYGSVKSAPAKRHIFIDEDGEWVLDYLEDVRQDRTEPPIFDWLKKHRDVVAQKLKEFALTPRILAKYQWVARYHNHTCARLPGCEEYVLDVRSFSLKRLEDDEEVLRRHRDRR